MKTKQKKQCNVDCGCKPEVKSKHQNGKGDKPRPTNQSNYNQNYEKINFQRENFLLFKSFLLLFFWFCNIFQIYRVKF